jgi:uncharacterized integral membrane protein
MLDDIGFQILLAILLGSIIGVLWGIHRLLIDIKHELRELNRDKLSR